MADTQSALATRERSPRDVADVVDVSALLSVLWSGKWLILLATAAGLIYGLRLVTAYEPSYEAQMVVIPIQQHGSAGQGFAAGAGLQSLGINLGPRQASNFDRFQLVFESLEFAEMMNAKHGLLHKIYADSWDKASGSWRRPQGERFVRNEALRQSLNRNNWREPSIQALSRFLRGSVKFKAVDQGQFQRITFAHRDRDFAIWLLSAAYAEAEQLIRSQDAMESAQRRQYLEEQLRRSTIIEVRQALAQLLTNEERQAMFMQGSLPYVARVAIAPYASEQPIEPDFLVMVSGPVLVGLGTALLILLLLVLMASELFSVDRRNDR
jgi:hypothetical protein